MRHLGKMWFLVCVLGLGLNTVVEAAGVPGAAGKTAKEAPAKEASVKAAPAAAKAAEQGKVNVNTANAEELSEGLIGVGPKKAEAIVAWRSANGPFKTMEDLLNVKGIGESLLQKNAGRVALK